METYQEVDVEIPVVSHSFWQTLFWEIKLKTDVDGIFRPREIRSTDWLRSNLGQLYSTSPRWPPFNIVQTWFLKTPVDQGTRAAAAN
ncbi:hypothetical protein PM082_004216 [Marasmius tenuissimus]|nr:hypothetical protein PM082_004216 [Marasmius tenuissimus]